MAIAFLANSIVGSSNGTTVTSGAIASTGATLLVVSVSIYNTSPTAAMLADGGVGGTNTWTALTDNFDTYYPLHQRQFYSVNPTKTGASHTVTFNPAAGTVYPCISFYAFSGTALSSVTDGESGANSGSSTVLTSLQTTGTVTPSANGALLVTGLTGNYFGTPTCDVGFNGNEVRVNSTANNVALATSYQIQTTATGRRPTWTFTAGYPEDISLTAFKAPAATGSVFTTSILSGFGAGGPFFPSQTG